MTYFEKAGERMYEFTGKIFPYTRSLTGQGVRDTLKDIEEYISVPFENEDGTTTDKGSMPKLKIADIPSGTTVFDWTVPKEWVIREAYIEDEEGNHIIDMKVNNLHVLGYSAPVDEWVDLEKLKQHVFVEEGQPEVIPYVTSYYKERFGFCMSRNQLDSLKPGRYHMYVDSEFIDGNLNYAEVIIPGESDREIMFTTYFCHPSMANNECSGLALQSELIRYVAAMPKRKYTYRFVFNPETIGAIAYLSNGNNLEYLQKNLEAGFVLSCVGDNNDYSIIESKYADTIADKALKCVLKYRGSYSTYNFHFRGSDERQYNSPGVDLPVVCYCRSKFGEFPEYHTSADNMSYVSAEGYQGSFEVMTELITAFEKNGYYRMKVLCEPQLGKRGLYSNISRKGTYDGIMLQRDVISYADGRNNLFDMSERFDVPVSEILQVTDKLIAADLMEVD
ncbi:MAG: DUF4910 domain-containing protein [Lachnospiraceae bacterium]|nr:DUF4910 domain-containing protein [Candidatus Colinaster scatohippi]